jgi:hypothetical protein
LLIITRQLFPIEMCYYEKPDDIKEKTKKDNFVFF